MGADRAVLDVTEDAVLGGRLRLRQPRKGHRVGHDAILLAAACPARDGEHAVEFGAGIGSVGLALAARVPGLKMTLLEIDPELCVLAADNARLNSLAEQVDVRNLDVTNADELASALDPCGIDRVLMNPPFHDETRANLSPEPGRRRAYAARPDTVALWIKSAGQLLSPGGTLSMIFRADGLGDLLGALGGEFGGIGILPVHPRADAPAIRVLLRAVKDSRAPLEIHPALTLNDGNRPTEAAEAILREGALLPLAQP